MNIFLLGFFVQTVYSLTTTEERCETRTSYGVLLGKHMTSRDARVFCGYFGVPYAMPPIGELRFQPPTSPQAWEGVRNATEEENICFQRQSVGSEDCLYLNVFAPFQSTKKPTAILVYIHGGGFHSGSSSTAFLGPEYFMDKDIVLVTLQYRLGPFGFLSTEDEVVPGNMGLKDQVKALQWVQENIRAFGGDPGQVTIFGSSTGGSSVHLHMQSPLSQHLFARGISQSGTAHSGFALAGKGVCKNVTNHIAITLNCSIISSEDILHCLQNKTSTEVLDAYNQQLNAGYNFNLILLRPVLEEYSENPFLTINPRRVKTEKPWLVGINANEGIFKISTKQMNETFQLIRTKFHSFGPKIMFFDSVYTTFNDAVNLIDKFYFENSSTTAEMIRSLEQTVTDSWFAWPTDQAVRQHNGSLYYYLYEHQGEHSFTEIFHCPKGYGVSHVDELIALFPQKSIFPVLNDQDLNITRLMVNFWVNFATDGNPTPHPISSNPQRNDSTNFNWEAANSSDLLYIHIQTTDLSMKRNIFSERMNFWRQLPLKGDF